MLNLSDLRSISVAAFLLLVSTPVFASSAWLSIGYRVELADVVVVGKIVAYEKNKRLRLDFDTGGEANLDGRVVGRQRWYNEATLKVTEALKVRFDTQPELTILSSGPYDLRSEPGRLHLPMSSDREFAVGTEGIWFLENVGNNDYRLVGAGIVPIDSLRHVKQSVFDISTRYKYVRPGFPTDEETWVLPVDVTNEKVAVAPNGAIFVAGNCRDQVPSDDGSWANTGWNGYCIKAIAPDGKTGWGQGERCSSLTAISDIVVDETGEITFAIAFDKPLAMSSAPEDTSRGVHIERWDGAGRPIWQREIRNVGYEPKWLVRGVSLAVASDGDVIVAASFRDRIRFADRTFESKGAHDILLAKLDRHGEVDWVTTHGGDADERLIGVAVSNNGQIAIGGSIRPPGQDGPFDERTMMVVYSELGVERWRYESKLGNVPVVAFTRKGNVVAMINEVDREGGNRIKRAVSLNKWNDDGKLEWSRPGGGADIAIGPNDEIVTIGTIGEGRPPQPDVPTPLGERDMFVACYGSSGKLLWSARDGGWGAEHVTGVAVAEGRLILIGGSEGMSYVAGNVIESSGQKFGTSFIVNIPFTKSLRNRTR